MTGQRGHAHFGGGAGDDILLKRGNTFFLDYEGQGGADLRFNYGNASDEVYAGDLSSDGIADLILRRGNTFFVDTNVSSTETSGRADHRWDY